eukprot:74928_1
MSFEETLKDIEKWSTTVTISYFFTYTLLMMIIAFVVYKKEKHTVDKTFLKSVWIQRKIYAQILVHFYDTATDLGVIITWYGLYQDEQNGVNYESVDMGVFFWGACAVLMLYRLLMIPIIYMHNVSKYDRTSCGAFLCVLKFCCQLPLAILDMFVFIAIYDSFKSAEDIMKENAQKLQRKRQRIELAKQERLKQKRELQRKVEQQKREIADKKKKEREQQEQFEDQSATNKTVYINFEENKDNLKQHLELTNQTANESKEDEPPQLFLTEENIQNIQLSDKDKKDVELQDIDPAAVQYFCMLAEAVFESMPQVVLQAAFLVRSSNDEILKKGSSQGLIYVSLISSVFSVANKFNLMDRNGVVDAAKSLKPKYKFPNCVQPWYLVRIFWRFFHILSRFSVFSLVWIVIGGAPLVIYIAIAQCFSFWFLCRQENFGVAQYFNKQQAWIYGLLGLVAIPICESPLVLLIFKWTECCVMMLIISLFATMEWQCPSCTDSSTRQMSVNDGIFALVVLGWISLVMDIVMFLMIKCKDIILDEPGNLPNF